MKQEQKYKKLFIERGRVGYSISSKLLVENCTSNKEGE